MQYITTWANWWLRWLSVCLQCGRPRFDPWVGKILWRRKWQPTPVLLPGKPHRWRSLVGYSLPAKELDVTEQLKKKQKQKQKAQHIRRVCILQGRKVVKMIPSRGQSLRPEGQAGVSWVKRTDGKHARVQELKTTR